MRFFKIDDVDVIDLDALTKMLPGGSMWNPFSTQGRYIRAILSSYSILEEYEINTPLRIAHFLGQGLIETGFLRYASENLNYSSSRLRAIFPKYVKTEEQAKQLHRKPEAIANLVYGGRLGNTEPGDGWKYRGRGFFQLTGKKNYKYFGDIAGIDLVSNPEIIEKDLKMSVRVAAAYFAHMKLGDYADQNDGRAVSRGINLGNPRTSTRAHGEADRLLWTERVLALFAEPAKIITEEPATISNRGIGAGASGPRVQDIQEKLTQLGYSVGQIDGAFGQKTERAVVNFQVEYGLEATGVVNEATMAAIDDAIENETRGNIDPARNVRPDREIRREVGGSDGAGAGGAIAGAGGAAGVAYETGMVDEVIEVGKEVWDQINENAENTDTQTDITPTDEMPVEEGTTTSTEVPAPIPQERQPAEQTDWLVVALMALVFVIGVYVFFRIRRRNKRAMDAYRDGLM